MQSESESVGSQREIHRYQALLDVTDLMVRHYSLPELFHELAQRLQRVAEFQLLHFSLHDPNENVMRRHLWEGEGPTIPEVLPVDESASGHVWRSQIPLLIRICSKTIDFRRYLSGCAKRDFAAITCFR